MTEGIGQGEAFALAHAAYAECQVVALFIDEKVRVPVDARTANVPHGIVFQGQLLRAIAWLRSIGKLNHPGDFQAVTAAARALFEGAVDVTLMHFDPKTFAPAKMDAWEDSAKLKHAQTMAAYLADLGRMPTTEELPILDFLAKEKTRIDGARKRFWPSLKGKHPTRWTGQDLAADAKAADKLHDDGFEAFYRLRYPQLCWNVHGSGLAGVANIRAEAFPYIGGRAYRESAKFAVVIAEVVARHMDCLDEAAFADLREQRRRAAVLVYGSTLAGAGA